MATISAQEFLKKGKPTLVQPASEHLSEVTSPSFFDKYQTEANNFANNLGNGLYSSGQKIISGYKQIKEGAKNFGNGGLQQIGRGILNEAGGAIEGIFNPVTQSLGEASKLPGISQGLDLIKNKVINPTADIASNIKSLQDFAMRNPNAEEVFQNGVTILSSLLGGKKAGEVGSETNLLEKPLADSTKNFVTRPTDVVSNITSNISNGANGIKTKVIDTIENVSNKIKRPETNQATMVSLNPKEALFGTGQDIPVSAGGKVKNLSELTPLEYQKMQKGTARSLDAFTAQAKKFAADRSVPGGSPVEIVGNRVDKALQFVEKKRQTVGQQMGTIELKYADQSLPIGDKPYKSFLEILKNFDNPKYGMGTADAPVVRKLISDFDTLHQSGATIGERLQVIRAWEQYLKDSKDPFGNFKDNATVNTRIQNAIRDLKTETVDAIAAKDKVYKNLRSQYRSFKNLEEIGDNLLGKDGAMGERIKGAATVKRAIQSNSDAGARQFLTKLKEISGYDAIKEGDLALLAMENVGDYQGLSLLNVLRKGKSGVVSKVIEGVHNKFLGDNSVRTKNFVTKKIKDVTPKTQPIKPIKNTTKSTISGKIFDKHNSTPNKQGGFLRIPNRIHSEDLGTIRDFTDYVNGAYTPSQQAIIDLEIATRRIVEKYKITNPNVSNRVLATQLGKVLDAKKFLLSNTDRSIRDEFGRFAGSTAKLPKSITGNSMVGVKSIPKELEPLAQEARKYKSAEEFVKAQKTPKYAMTHRPSEGPRAFDLTELVDGEQMIPKDMYQNWYGSRGTAEDIESINALKKIKGNPEAEITIYRAAPKNELNYGDWVTFSKKYAQMSAREEGTPINAFKVKAKDIRWAMDDVNEFGYYPSNETLTDFYNKVKGKK